MSLLHNTGMTVIRHVVEECIGQGAEGIISLFPLKISLISLGCKSLDGAKSSPWIRQKRRIGFFAGVDLRLTLSATPTDQHCRRRSRKKNGSVTVARFAQGSCVAKAACAAFQGAAHA
jgi:hypothetical protein